MQTSWLLFALLRTAHANESVESGATVSATVRLGTSGCIRQPTACAWMDFRDTTVFGPWVRAKLSDSVSTTASFDIRIHGPATGYGMENEPEPLDWSFKAHDVWVATRTRHTEFKFGVFRTAWGVAEGMSVVDTINPLDFENPTRFDRRLSVPSAQFTGSTGRWILSGVFIPFFVPAALPPLPTQLFISEQELVDQRITGGDGTTIGSLASQTTIPNNDLSNTTVGGQLRWSPGLADIALSWHRGRDSLPQVAGDVLVVGYQTDTNQMDVGLPLIYPQLNTIGFTTRMRLLESAIAWIEIAHILPETTSASPSAAQLDALVKLGTIPEMPDPIPTTITQDGKPYTRSIAGGSVPVSRVLLTAQWLRGFFTERRARNLKNYALVGLQWSASESVRFQGQASLNKDGYLGTIGIEYLHDDTVEIGLGIQQIDGKDGTTFAGLRQASNLFARVSMQF